MTDNQSPFFSALTSNNKPEKKEDLTNTAYVILLSVESDLCDLLANSTNKLIKLHQSPSSKQMFNELEQMDVIVDAIVIGVQLEEPVRIAQRIHSMGKDIPLLIMTESSRHEQLKQALKFAPYIGNDVLPFPTAGYSLTELPEILTQMVIRTQKRRSYRGSVAAAQKRLSDVKSERPQASYYLDRLLDYAPIGILNVNIQGEILGLNRRASQLLKLSERQALGMSLSELFLSSQRDTLHNMIAQCVAPSRQPTPEIFDISHTVNIQRYIEIIASSLVDRSGQLGATLIIQDVSARVSAEQQRSKAEQALRISEKGYRELVQTMNEALALTDDQHNITFVNDSFCQLFDYASEHVIGKPLLDFVHSDDKDAMKHHMDIGCVERFETAWVTRTGKKIFTLTSPKPIRDPEMGYLGYLSVLTDITEHKQIEEREKQHLKELYHVSRVTTIGEMSSQVAHELAQPLTAISVLSTACLKMMHMGNDDRDEIIDALSDVNQQAKRARNIIVRLRNFVHYEEMQYSRIDLNKLVRTVVHLVEMEARWHQLVVSLELYDPLPSTVGDRLLIEQVVMNLVHNAIEAMLQSDGRKLIIRTSLSSNSDLLVEVIDSGPGLSDTDLKQIFEPFFTTKTDGMGMGLAITRSIIEAHNGSVSARQNKQGGAVFSFTLAAQTEESE